VPVRLFAFPYAGGTAAAVRGWQPGLGRDVELIPVALPGRDALMFEEPLSTHAAALEHVCETLLPQLEPPYALYGHSMGARLAFELAREIARRDLPAPARLLVSGAAAPCYGPPAPFAHLPDDAFVARLRELGGTPEALLEHTELLELLLPRLRGDFAVAESYAYTEAPPLECPISAWGGLEDGYPREKIAAWGRETAAGFALRMVPGGHFFVHDRPGAMAREALADLREALDRTMVGTA
jgi:surfactin synthase thioesterase subunit